MTALYHVLLVQRHVITQVVKAELVVGAVCDIRIVRFAAFIGAEVVYNQADAQTEEAVDLSHPLRVTLGKIIIDRDDMHTVSGQRVQIGRQNGDKRFAFTGLHLGNASLMQDNAANELHAVRTHPEHTVCRFPADGKCLRKQVLQRFTSLIAGLEFLGLCAKLLICQLADLVSQCFNSFHRRHQLPDLTLRTGAEYFAE